MTALQSPSRWWEAWVLKAVRPARPALGEAPEPESEELPFPATGAHWLDGWVVFGNTYL